MSYNSCSAPPLSTNVAGTACTTFLWHENLATSSPVQHHQSLETPPPTYSLYFLHAIATHLFSRPTVTPPPAIKRPPPPASKPTLTDSFHPTHHHYDSPVSGHISGHETEPKHYENPPPLFSQQRATHTTIIYLHTYEGNRFSP